MKNILILLIAVFVFSTVEAQTVNVVLKNSKVVVGEVVQEEPEHLVIVNDMGQIRINRQNIESISYDQFAKLESSAKNLEGGNVNFNKSNSDKNDIVLNDLVLVYLKNGDIISGTLLAKSLDVILVKTEAGSLTIPKKQLQKIEYLSGEFSERGEVVIARLLNGNRFEGNIYYEDFKNLIIDTKVGRLTIDKANLRAIEYTGEKGKGDDTLKEYAIKEDVLKNTQEAKAEKYIPSVKEQPFVEPRLDILSLGYAPTFGADYSTGLGLGYSSKFLISHMDGFYISAFGGLNLNYFSLNSDAFTNEPFPVSASGGSIFNYRKCRCFIYTISTNCLYL